MHVPYAKTLVVFITAAVPLIGPQTLSAECVSARFADQVYHSCSGVLTVMPHPDGQPVGPSRERDSSPSATGPGIQDRTPDPDEEGRPPHNP